MKNEPLSFLTAFQHRLLLLSFLFTITIVTLLLEVFRFYDFKKEELIVTQGKVLNIYKKQDRDIFKVKTNEYVLFTSLEKPHSFSKYDNIQLTINTTQVKFFDFLKGFYVKSFNIDSSTEVYIHDRLIKSVVSQHQNSEISELFLALFMALPLSEGLRDFFASLGVSHLIAISGFHLSVLSLVIYGMLNFAYSFLHQRFFPYRNKKFDITLLTTIVLFSYLVLTGFVPSLLRAFIMLIFGFILVRSNIRVLSFETLLYTLLFIIALFPSYAFSLSLWFSIMGVFYIFLYIKYFQNIPKLLALLLFNFWIFFCFNPVVHYFFEQTSLFQLFSPLITLSFSFFYPIELLLHLIGSGSLLDGYLQQLIQVELNVYSFTTNLWFFVIYMMVSLLSIWFKNVFYLLNLLLIGFNLLLFCSN